MRPRSRSEAFGKEVLARTVVGVGMVVLHPESFIAGIKKQAIRTVYTYFI
jgi:hypothetical protein